ncbi:hypothetical protein NIES4074_50270 [Cylindrospermum sp. NIES-4074]|nr:hypothetical protein NIES4074_50270 [Cylindrospermum sp. NIES-4074]
MNHFNLKSLTFYGVAIGSVLILFKTVTAYGESQLKPSPTINSRYRLTLAKNLPNCEQANTLMLNIQQSGIYVNASLLPANTNAETEKPLSLTGLLKDQQLQLSGKIDQSILCNKPQSQTDPIETVMIQMPLVKKGDISGQLKVNSIPQTLGFTAVPQSKQQPSPKADSH